MTKCKKAIDIMANHLSMIDSLEKSDVIGNIYKVCIFDTDHYHSTRYFINYRCAVSYLKELAMSEGRVDINNLRYYGSPESYNGEDLMYRMWNDCCIILSKEELHG